MDTGRPVKIHKNVPEPIVIPKPKPEDQPILVPDWPVKAPVKEPEKIDK